MSTAVEQAWGRYAARVENALYHEDAWDTALYYLGRAEDDLAAAIAAEEAAKPKASERELDLEKRLRSLKIHLPLCICDTDECIIVASCLDGI